MNPSPRKHEPSRLRRRFLVHLLCVFECEREGCCYVARIRPWSARNGVDAITLERTFADDSELIATINPLLPPGSDVRDVFEHIESPNGFFYILHLNSEEAMQLGWHA